MAREMREVWVELDQHGRIRRARSGDEPPFAMSTVHPRHEVKRLPLLTPHDAAVLEAAERLASATLKVSAAHMLGQPSQGEAQALMREIQESVSAVEEAVRARRAANAGGEP
jgi:hypothetical protein